MNRFIVSVAFIVSVCSSLLLFNGLIDQDYFSYLHLGRGVLSGLNPYVDFADNKGLVLYLFFTILAWISQYVDPRIVLVLFSTLIDLLGIIFLLKIFNIYGLLEVKNKLILSIELISVSLVYKCFSIGPFWGGLYSQQIAMPFVLLAIFFVVRDRYFISGILFGLSLNIRQTMALYLIIFLFIFYVNKVSKRHVFNFLLGNLLVILLFVMWLLGSGSVADYFYNVWVFNLNYAQVVKAEKWNSFWRLIFSNIDLAFYSLIYGVSCFLILLTIFKEKSWKLMLAWISMLVFTILFYLLGGKIWYHHFLQIVPLFLISIFWLKNYFRVLFTFLIVLLFLITTSIFVINWHLGMSGRYNLYRIYPKLTLPISTKYIQLYQFYPKVYWDLEKKSPDKHYQPFFLEKAYNSDFNTQRDLHKKNLLAVIDDVTFIEINSGNNNDTSELMETMKKDFDLEVLGEYQYGESLIIVYKSKL